jgi:NAD(P)-dependent dehydrogenase (short-subunit alcohol dehydrogenase family)/acyl carrier protein
VRGLFAKRALEDRVLKRDTEWDRSIYEIRWKAVAADTSAVYSRDIVLLGPSSELLTESAAAFPSTHREHTVVLSEPDQLVETPIWRSGRDLTVALVIDRSCASGDATLPARTASLLARVARDCAARLPASRLVVVARGAVDVGNASGPAPELAALFGMARALASEVPRIGCMRIDLDPAVTSPVAARMLPAMFALAVQQPEVAWRDGRAFAPHVERVTLPNVSSPSAGAARGTAIVTGGLGALGGVAALALARAGYSHIVLLGRRLEVATEGDHLAKARALTVDVVSAVVDVANRQQLAGLLLRLRQQLPPIRAIVHAAGVRDDAVLERLDDARIQSVFAGKVAGAMHLHELTAADPVELFMAFGSASAWYPNAGQSAYAAANAALDAIMAARRAAGKPGVCLQWGPWTIGMAAGVAPTWEREGIVAATPEHGLAVLEQYVAERTALPPAPLVLRTTDRVPASTSAPVNVAGPRETSNAAFAAADRVFRDDLLAMPARDRKRATVRYLQRAVASMMGLADSELPPINTGLTELGLDSLMAVDLRCRLEAVLASELPATVALEHPTIELLATFLVNQLEFPTPGVFERVEAPGDMSDSELMLLLSAELGTAAMPRGPRS